MPFEVSWCPKLTKSEKRSISKPSPPFRRRKPAIRGIQRQLYEFDTLAFSMTLCAKLCAETAKVGAMCAAMEPQAHPKCPKVTKGQQHVSEGWRNVGQGVVQWTPKVKPAHGLHRIRHACLPMGCAGQFSMFYTSSMCSILGGALGLDFRVCWACVGELDFRVWLGWGFEVGF